MEQIQDRKSKAYYYFGALLVAIAIISLVAVTTFEALFGIAQQAYSIALAIASFLILISSFIITHRNLKKDRPERQEALVLSILRFVLSTVMLGYAFTKLHHGHMYLSYFSLDNRLNDLNDFDTVWSFYGRYSAFQTLIGIMEFVPALLLLFRRTTFLGAALLFPVIANVVLLNAFYKIGGFTLPLSFMLTVFDVYILYSYKAQILEFLRKVSGTPSQQQQVTGGKKILHLAKFIPLVFVSALIFLQLIKPKNEQVLHGAFQLLELRQNDHLVPNDSLPADAYKKIYFEKRHIQNSLINAQGPQGATIAFPAKDSITIAYRNGPLDVYVKQDTVTMFKGHFRLDHDSLLVISGTQNRQRITARYTKVPLREYTYWWE